MFEFYNPEMNFNIMKSFLNPLVNCRSMSVSKMCFRARMWDCVKSVDWVADLSVTLFAQVCLHSKLAPFRSAPHLI